MVLTNKVSTLDVGINTPRWSPLLGAFANDPLSLPVFATLFAFNLSDPILAVDYPQSGASYAAGSPAQLLHWID